MLPSEDARAVVAALGIQRRRCRFQRIRGVVRARVHRARALASAGAGARMLELVRCARLVLAGWPSACVAEVRGPGKPWCFTAPLPSEAVRHTIPALRIVKTKVCGQELRLVLLCPSHETIGQNSWPCSYLMNVCASAWLSRTVSRYPLNGESGDGWSCGRG